MNISDRIARLEGRLRAAAQAKFPIFIVTMDGGGDKAQPLFAELDGNTWRQEPEESAEHFKGRATRAALAVCRPKGKFPTLFLAVQRPAPTA